MRSNFTKNTSSFFSASTRGQNFRLSLPYNIHREFGTLEQGDNTPQRQGHSLIAFEDRQFIEIENPNVVETVPVEIVPPNVVEVLPVEIVPPEIEISPSIENSTMSFAQALKSVRLTNASRSCSQWDLRLLQKRESLIKTEHSLRVEDQFKASAEKNHVDHQYQRSMCSNHQLLEIEKKLNVQYEESAH